MKPMAGVMVNSVSSTFPEMAGRTILHVRDTILLTGVRAPLYSIGWGHGIILLAGVLS